MLVATSGIVLAAVSTLTVHPAAAQHVRGSTPGKVLVVSADKLCLGDGREIDNGKLLIEDGIIRAVSAELETPEGASTIEHHGTLGPGLIALHGYPGASADLRDSSRPELPDAEAAVAFNAGHFEFTEAVQAGITCQALTPPPQSLIGGISAVVKTAGGRVLKREAQLALGFSAETLSSNRFPTSHAGAQSELERLFEQPEGVLAKVAAGKLPVLMEVETRQDVLRAVEFAARHKLKGSLHGAAWAGEVADEIKGAQLAVVCGPFDVGSETRALRSVVKLAQAGVPIAFGLDAPWTAAANLRLSAALCVREGLPRAAAWKALHADAAKIAGVADHVGRLERGLDADFVLWSGDPLDLTSSVVAVFIEGKCVFGADRR